MKKAILSIVLVIALVAGLCSVSVGASQKSGDVDFDGLVTAEDALLVLRATSGTTTLSSAQIKAADVTYDGKINSVDALRILLYVCGSINSLDKLGGEEGDDIII